jgi:hypothetical protein
MVPSSPILVTLMMEALRSSKMTVLTRDTRRNIPEDGIRLPDWKLRGPLTRHLVTSIKSSAFFFCPYLLLYRFLYLP